MIQNYTKTIQTVLKISLIDYLELKLLKNIKL